MNGFDIGTVTCPSTSLVISSPGCAIGSNTARCANSAFKYMISGVVYSKAAVAAGTAPTATAVPASKFGLFGYEIGVDGTIHNKDAADNATGYDTFAAALAALPTATAGHLLFMYFIVQAKGTGAWTGATDDLDATSDCQFVAFRNVALTPGYTVSLGYAPRAVEVYNRNRNCWMRWDDTLSDGYGWTNHYADPSLLSSPRCAIGSTTANCANSQFDYIINNTVYTKAAVTAGTAPSATTVPQGKWGLFGFEIGSDGTIDKKDAADNATGYDTEALALAAIPTASANHVLFMVFTVQAKAAANWVGATDDLVAASDCDAVNFYNVTPASPLTAHGITPIDDGTYRGFRIGYYSELVMPGDTLYYKCWR